MKGEKMNGIASVQVRRAIHSGTADYFSPFTFYFSRVPPAACQGIHT